MNENDAAAKTLAARMQHLRVETDELKRELAAMLEVATKLVDAMADFMDAFKGDQR